MARGLPDDSNIVKEGWIFGLDDMAELAARLDGVQGVDRLGHVIYLNTFESGLTGIYFWGDAPGCLMYPSGDYSKSQGVSAYLATRAVATSEVSWVRGQMYPSTLQLGEEFSFSLFGAVRYVRLYLDVFTGARWFQFYLRYDHTNGDLHYYVPGPGWTPLVNLGILYSGFNIWHNVKLVIDLTTMSYVRALIDGVVYLMTGLIPMSAGNLTAAHIAPGGSVYTSTPVVAELYLDNFILTQNEP